jgi:hypothetical protein
VKWHRHQHVARFDPEQIDAAHGGRGEHATQLRRALVLEAVNRWRYRVGVARTRENRHACDMTSHVEQGFWIAAVPTITRSSRGERFARCATLRREQVERRANQPARDRFEPHPRSVGSNGL